MMFANWRIKWQNTKTKSTLFTRKTINTTSVNSNSSQKDVQSSTSHYKSIHDCPVKYFDMAISNEDSRYLYILDDYSNLPEKRIDNVLEKIWWEYLEEKGFDANFKLAYDFKIRLAELRFEQAQGMDREIDIAETESSLKDLFSGKKQKLSDEVALLSKFMGQWLDTKKITVYDFIGIENLFIESNKKDG